MNANRRFKPLFTMGGLSDRLPNAARRIQRAELASLRGSTTVSHYPVLVQSAPDLRFAGRQPFQCTASLCCRGPAVFELESLN